MPSSPFSISCIVLFIAICICDIGSIVILRNIFFNFIDLSPVGAIVVLTIVSNILALSSPFVFGCHADPWDNKTVHLIAFGTFCILHFPSCITLPIRARQDNATALCQDLMESDDCTGSIVLICLYYASTIFAIIGFVITYIVRRASILKVTPRYPNARVASSNFQVAAIRYPQDFELGNVPAGRASNRK